MYIKIVPESRIESSSPETKGTILVTAGTPGPTDPGQMIPGSSGESRKRGHKSRREDSNLRAKAPVARGRQVLIQPPIKRT